MNTKKLTFKEYYESKEKLVAALQETPVYSVTYTINKYCKIPLGETKQDKEYVTLKPKQKVVVEWKHNLDGLPKSLNLIFEDVDGISNKTQFTALWSDERLQKWLIRNTREHI